ncbi:dynein regulatory complex protein 10 isoform X2 [Spea bombifrons]|nr:dynein regulatory complex protein 10 isoform X2 [Spea bombifrons]
MTTEVISPFQALMSSSPQPLESPLNNESSPLKKGPNKALVKIDSMKVLEPGRKKLTSIETQRIIAVLDETIKKLELVTLFQHAANNLDRFSVVFGSELTGAIREHQRLQNNMQQQLNRINRENAADRKSPELDERNLSTVREAIQSSVRNTLRLFLANPIASKALQSEAHVRDLASQQLIQILSELRDFLFEMLLTSPLELNQRMCYLQKTMQRDLKNRDALATLEEELNKAILDRDTEISKKNEVIRQLKISLHQLEKVSESQVRRIMQEAEKQQKSDRRASEGKCAKLQQDLQHLRSQLSATIAENREIELNLRKKKYKVETEIENWIQKYDADMGEKQAELEELEALYAEEKAHLEELRDKLAVLEVEYVQIVEERRLAQLKKEAAEKELANMTRAATVIQAFWKGYQVRKTMRSKKKKKKKGKGTGKKGKGKKGKK